ncbi:hypothetical protein [Xenorhabdus sp. PB30.3]|uniref:hypothetical protein n=1 Tax=Xenorhabdus sp. PB30.3 TaxID=2788941 RepID=UPI001E51A7A8|nr:hypothetical protein [Xenorhabdus sp. PB30.3]MCC8380464.1 hypothetical protein [Xenorhabdus sp. PB30.3]
MSGELSNLSKKIESEDKDKIMSSFFSSMVSSDDKVNAIRRVGNFIIDGKVNNNKEAMKYGDLFYINIVGPYPVIVKHPEPNDDWVCVGTLDRYDIDNVLNYMTEESRTIDSFNLARDSKQKRGGGIIHIPAGDYYLEDELVMVNFVRFEGEGERTTRLFGSPNVNGTGKSVVRSCSTSINSKDEPKYLSHTGISNCTINGNETWDCCLYIRLTTNESKFINVTTQSAKFVNTNLLASWYVNLANHVSRDAMNYGIVIGKKLFKERGLEEVNACSLLNMRSNYSGIDDKYHPTDNAYAGSGIIIWSANSCAFDYLGAENSYGVGILARKGINSTLGDIYTEGNGKGSKSNYPIGLMVINADFPVLRIGSLNLTEGQKIFLSQEDAIISAENIYTHDFSNGIFKGNGKVILNGIGIYNRLSPDDQKYIENKSMARISEFHNFDLTSWQSLNETGFLIHERTNSVIVSIVPRENSIQNKDVIIRLNNNGADGQFLNFGKKFTKNSIISKRFNAIDRGFWKLEFINNAVNNQLMVDIYIYQYKCAGEVLFEHDF